MTARSAASEDATQSLFNREPQACALFAGSPKTRTPDPLTCVPGSRLNDAAFGRNQTSDKMRAGKQQIDNSSMT